MKFAKFFALAMLASFTFNAFADAANLMLSFSTVGPDLYADGKTAVADGEWYALCWTPNDTFGGITTDFTPVTNGDKIMMAAPLAQGGHCSYTVFQIDSNSIPDGGKYFVYLLDTRDANGKPAAKSLKEGKLTPAVLNGAVAATKFTTSSNSESSEASSKTVTEDKSAVADAKWDESKIDTTAAGFTQAKIVEIDPSGLQVQITVEGMMPGIKYNIKAGETVDSIKDYPIDPQMVKSGERAQFFIEKSQGKFFQIVRQPLTK